MIRYLRFFPSIEGHNTSTSIQSAANRKSGLNTKSFSWIICQTYFFQKNTIVLSFRDTCVNFINYFSFFSMCKYFDPYSVQLEPTTSTFPFECGTTFHLIYNLYRNKIINNKLSNFSLVLHFFCIEHLIHVCIFLKYCWQPTKPKKKKNPKYTTFGKWWRKQIFDGFSYFNLPDILRKPFENLQ